MIMFKVTSLRTSLVVPKTPLEGVPLILKRYTNLRCLSFEGTKNMFLSVSERLFR